MPMDTPRNLPQEILRAVESVVGAGPATLNAGTKTWTATIKIQPVVGATGRLVVQAVMLNRNGRIMRSTIRKQAKA